MEFLPVLQGQFPSCLRRGADLLTPRLVEEGTGGGGKIHGQQTGGTAPLGMPAMAQLPDDLADKSLGISEEHQGLLIIIEGIIDARNSFFHSSLDDHHRLPPVLTEYWHAVYGAAAIRARPRI